MGAGANCALALMLPPSVGECPKSLTRTAEGGPNEMNKYLYEAIAYTGQWSHRRKFFPSLDDAKEWAKSEFEEDDVCEVWLTTIATATGEIVENEPILTK